MSTTFYSANHDGREVVVMVDEDDTLVISLGTEYTEAPRKIEVLLNDEIVFEHSTPVEPDVIETEDEDEPERFAAEAEQDMSYYYTVGFDAARGGPEPDEHEDMSDEDREDYRRGYADGRSTQSCHGCTQNTATLRDVETAHALCPDCATRLGAHTVSLRPWATT